MPEEQVKALMREVAHGMADHAVPNLTEVYFPSTKDSDFFENGTGAFAEVEHVARF